MRSQHNILTIVLLCLTLFSGTFLASCGHKMQDAEGSSANEAETYTTEPDTEKAPSKAEGFRLLVPATQNAHICTDELYAFLEQARTYDVTNYAYTCKNDKDLGSNTDGAKVCWGYENAGEVKEVWMTFSEDGSFANTTRYKATKPTARSKEGYVNVPNLYTGETYYFYVEVTMKDGSVVKSDISTFTTDGPRIMTVLGIKNMRDLGGYMTESGKKIKQGLLYRTAKPNDLTPQGAEYLVQTLGMKGELDLRNPDSESDAPVSSPIENDVNYLICSGVKYESFWENPNRVREEFAYFLEEDNFPLFFHCLAGADRTGSLAFLIEALLGMEENEMVADYEITPNKYRIGDVTDSGYFYDFPRFVSVFKAFPGEKNSDKARYFLTEQCGFTDAELDWFIDFMLED